MQSELYYLFCIHGLKARSFTNVYFLFTFQVWSGRRRTNSGNCIVVTARAPELRKTDFSEHEWHQQFSIFSLKRYNEERGRWTFIAPICDCDTFETLLPCPFCASTLWVLCRKANLPIIYVITRNTSQAKIMIFHFSPQKMKIPSFA